MLLNGGCCTRDSRQVEDHLVRRFRHFFARHLRYEEKGSKLAGGHFACSVGNHLQQALQIKLRGERDSDAVKLRLLFRPCLQISDQLRAALIDSLCHSISKLSVNALTTSEKD